MQQKIFSDPSIPAYFQASKKDFKISAQKNPTNKQIDFVVEGDGAAIEEALAELYTNPLVPALSLIGALKSLRSSIFALRDRKEAVSGNRG